MNSAGPLITDNPELRVELLKLLLEHKERFKYLDMKCYIPSILSCLQDRSASIRLQAENLFAETIGAIKLESYRPFLKDIKPAVMNTLNIVFNKYKSRVSEIENELVALPPRISRSSTSIVNNNIKKIPPRENSCRKNSIILKNLNEIELKSPVKKSKSMLFGSIAADRIIDAKLISLGNKDKRLEIESKNKWNVEDIRVDYQERVKEEMKCCMTPDLFNLLYHNDFQKRVEGVGYLTSLLNVQRRKIIEILDIILKWV